MNKTLLICALFVLFSACNNNQKAKCLYGNPTAIFKKDLPGIVAHEFANKGQNGRELIRFSEGWELEILQGGCNSIQQEFRFSLPGKAPQDNPKFWIGQSIQVFHRLGDLAEQYMIYHQYANAIEEVGANMNLGESMPLGEGFFIKVDRIPGADYNLLVVEVAQGSEEK